MNRYSAGLNLIGLIAGITLAGCTPPDPNAAADANKAAADANTAASEAEALLARHKTWQYRESRDEMRGTVTKAATIDATNTIQLDFPYEGDTSLELMLRKQQGEFNIVFIASQGQLTGCNSYSGGSFAAKFDDGAVQNFSCVGSADGSSEVMFVQNESRFLNQLKTAKKLMIETEFFQAGNRQFTFEVAGLDPNF